VKAQRVEEPVNLVDLGPTLLDWFGVDTPDFMAGESLLPTVLEGPRALSRPLFAEGRLRRAIFIGDLKVIVDERRKTVEAFDLATDPAELTNVYESDPARVRPALAALHRYFERRSASRDGYRPIYKP
jgi:arylsulfatase A-like enzyme